MHLERLKDDLILQMPDFIHQFCPDRNSDNPYCHEGINYRTLEGYVRHRTIERVLLFFRILLEDYDAIHFCYTFQSFLSLLFGFNCGFPAKDIALYVAWELRGCKPVAEFKKIEDNWVRVRVW